MEHLTDNQIQAYLDSDVSPPYSWRELCQLLIVRKAEAVAKAKAEGFSEAKAEGFAEGKAEGFAVSLIAVKDAVELLFKNEKYDRAAVLENVATYIENCLLQMGHKHDRQGGVEESASTERVAHSDSKGFYAGRAECSANDCHVLRPHSPACFAPSSLKCRNLYMELCLQLALFCA
jgi:hypothetical protein